MKAMNMRGLSLLYTLSNKLAIAVAVCVLVFMTSFPMAVRGDTPPEILDIHTNSNGIDSTWFNLAGHGGKRIVVQLADRAGGVTASVSATQSEDWDFKLVASQVTLPSDINNRRAVFLFEATVPSGMSTHPIISSEVLNGTSTPVSHTRLAILVDVGDEYQLSAVAGDDSGTSAVLSQDTGTTGQVPAGNLFVVAGASLRGDTSTTDWDLTTDAPANPGGGTWDLKVTGSGTFTNRAHGSMGYYAGTSDSAQTWEDTITIDTSRHISALVAVWSDGAGSGNSIQMSSASQSAENVDYRLRLVDMENIQSMVIDFCSDSPLIGTDCTAPTGMDTSGVSVTDGDWSATSGADNRVNLTSSSEHTTGTIVIPMTGIDNPSDVGTFYARIYVYPGSTNAYSSPTDLGTGADEPAYLAAIALAITDDIGVTLIIPEYIEFCVYDIECGDTPAIVLGQGDPPALSTSQVDSESVQFEVATNASLGVSLRIKGPTLNMGSSEIPPNCSVDSWFDPDMPRGTALTAGTAGFGVEAVVDGYIPPNTGDEDQLEPHPAYLDWDFSGSASMGDYAFFGGCGQAQGYDTEPDSEYGSTFAFSNGPLSGASGDLVFRAAISNATAAGIYQTTLQVIATGYY